MRTPISSRRSASCRRWVCLCPAAPTRSSDYGGHSPVLSFMDPLIPSSIHRDLSSVGDGQPLKCVGVLTEHSRPVESLDTRVLSEKAAVLYTADTMGIIRVWEIMKDDNDRSLPWKIKLAGELKHHRTRVDDMIHGDGHLWTGCTFPTPYCFALPHVFPHSISR